MNLIYYTFFLLLLICNAIIAGQPMTPADGDSLYFIQIPFRWNQLPDGVCYNVQIAVDGGASPFEDSLIVDFFDSSTVCVTSDGLEFGKSYLWRYRGHDINGSFNPWQDTLSFHTRYFPAENWNFQNTLYDTNGFCPGLTFFEGFNPTISQYTYCVDYYGKMIWFAPPGTRTDQELLNNGYLLFLAPTLRIITLNRVILWMSPEGDYHHEINLLPNGNILVLEHEYQYVEKWGDTILWKGDVIEEMMMTGEIVWSWNSFDYISLDDFDSTRLVNTPPENAYDWTHGNSCTYNPSDNSIYFSARNLSRIVKIDKATGDIIWSMGQQYASGQAQFGDSLFWMQHAPEPQPNGNLLLYNNNWGWMTPNNSSAVEIAFDFTQPEPATVVWEYVQEEFSSIMGDADRLSNGNTLICAGNQSYLLEVNQAGEEIWRFDTDLYAIYRADRVPSLYPQLFCVITPGANIDVPSDSGSIVFQIYNKGFLPDTFNIDFHDSQGWFNPPDDTLIVEEYSSIELELGYQASYSPLVDTLTLIVRSSLNPEVSDTSIIFCNLTQPVISDLRIIFALPHIIIDWEDIPDAEMYYIYRSDQPYFNLTGLEPIGSTIISQYADSSAILNDSYFYRVTWE